MCNAKKDGGQRCYAHAKTALDAAISRFEKDKGGFFEDRAVLRRRLVDFATTERGRQELEVRRGYLGEIRFDGITGQDMEHVLEEGRLLEERNKTIAEISKAERQERRLDKAKRLKRALTTAGMGTAATGLMAGSAVVQQSTVSVVAVGVLALATASDTARAVAKARRSPTWGERRVETEAREEVALEAGPIAGKNWVDRINEAL